MSVVTLDGKCDQPEGTYILPISAMPTIRAACKSRFDVELLLSAGSITIAGIRFDTIEGRFPDWRRVSQSEAKLIPDAGDTLYRADYMAEAYKACGKLTPSKYNAVGLRQYGALNSPTARLAPRVLPDNITEAYVIIRGMKP